jgi:hypothetical protein
MAKYSRQESNNRKKHRDVCKFSRRPVRNPVQLNAIGFAVSADGLHWHKSSANPVLRPDPQRAWESHYVTSQSVMRIGKGRFRIWYASRRKPPFRNKYFALNTDV